MVIYKDIKADVGQILGSLCDRFKEAVDEMMRARTLCAKANACMPDDPQYVKYIEEVFDRNLDDVRILTPFI